MYVVIHVLVVISWFIPLNRTTVIYLILSHYWWFIYLFKSDIE